jgi:hypothetical protein
MNATVIIAAIVIVAIAAIAFLALWSACVIAGRDECAQ